MTESFDNITGVLMAAGRGMRLGGLTTDRPKALVKVAGRPLIDHGIAFLRAAHIERIAVVGGYYYDDLAQHVKSVEPSALMVRNPAFEMQNGTSLKTVLERVEGNLLICDCDYIRTLEQARFVGRVQEEVTLFVSGGKTSDPDVMFVAISPENQVSTLSKSLAEYHATSAGMFFVPSRYRDPLIDATDAAIERLGAKEARIEDALVEFINRGVPVMAVDIGSRDWVEIDTPEEREAAERFVVMNRERLALL